MVRFGTSYGSLNSRCGTKSDLNDLAFSPEMMLKSGEVEHPKLNDLGFLLDE